MDMDYKHTTTKNQAAIKMAADMSGLFERALRDITRERTARWPVQFTDGAIRLALANTLGVDRLADNTDKCVEAAMAAQRSRPWLLFTGGVGRGKTALMRVILAAISAHPSRPKQLYAPARDLALNADLADRARSVELLTVDDLGTEPAQVLTYGTPINPLAALIEHRYDRGLATYITTNIPGKTLAEVYGSRVVSRIQELAGVVNFDQYFTHTLR